MIEANQTPTIIYDSQVFDASDFERELVSMKIPSGTTLTLANHVIAMRGVPYAIDDESRFEKFQLCDYCGTTASDGKPNCRNCGAPA